MALKLLHNPPEPVFARYMLYIGVEHQSYFHVADAILNQVVTFGSTCVTSLRSCLEGLVRTVSGDAYTTALVVGSGVLFVSVKAPLTYAYCILQAGACRPHGDAGVCVWLQRGTHLLQPGARRAALSSAWSGRACWVL